jgi:hypothetical protein
VRRLVEGAIDPGLRVEVEERLQGRVISLIGHAFR